VEFSKLHRVCREESELEKCKTVLFTHYERIKNIFQYYIGTSSYPTISMNDFTSFSTKCGILDGKYINLSTLDRTLITTNVALHSYTSSAERDLQRYEFLEIIVRLANTRYKDTHMVDNVGDGVDRFLHELIYPNAKSVDGNTFRKYHCYNMKVNELLKKNELVLRKMYESFTHSKKKYVTLQEIQ